MNLKKITKKSKNYLCW